MNRGDLNNLYDRPLSIEKYVVYMWEMFSTMPLVKKKMFSTTWFVLHNLLGKLNERVSHQPRVSYELVKPALTAACPQKSALLWPHAGASASRPVPSACRHPPQSRHDADTKGARLKQRTPASKFSTSYLVGGYRLRQPFDSALIGRHHLGEGEGVPVVILALHVQFLCAFGVTGDFLHHPHCTPVTRDYIERRTTRPTCHDLLPALLYTVICVGSGLATRLLRLHTHESWRIGVGGDDEMQLDSQADPTHPGSGGSRCLIEHSCLHVDGCISYPSNHQHRLSHRLPARKNSSLTFLFF
jgi:hypothetical protein